MLTQAQIDEYNRIGAIVVPDVLCADEVQELRRVTDEFVEKSRTVSTHNEIYDLEDSHSADSRGCGASRRRTRTIPPTAAWSGTQPSSGCCATCGDRIFASTRLS